MRNLLITAVLLSTAGAFYSALWYKSTEIENDISASVTDALAQDAAKNIAIDVDGRHVTLTGVVYDEATEARYLETANKTYGALGPIDGLTYQPDSGYISAVKTANGFSLRGTVPSEDARATLIANAQAAANGATVDDQLVVAGPQADWQDEAAYGLTQMAGLKEGTLMAAAGTFSLSGMTDGDPQAVNAAFADRAGWETFVSAPTVISDLSGELARLNGALETEKSATQTLTAELAETKASLSEFDTLITQQGETIANLNGKVEELTAENAALTDELNGSDAKIAAAAALAETLTTSVDTNKTQLSALQADLGAANRVITDLKDRIAERDTKISNLTGQVETRDTAIADLTSKIDQRGLTIERLNGDVDALYETVDGLNGKVAELETLTQSTKGEDTAQIAALTQSVAERDATIKSLEEVIGETLDEGRAKAASLTDGITTRDATIARLNNTLGSTQGEVAVLTGQLAIRENRLSGTAAQIAALTDSLAKRDQTIADLQARPAVVATPARDLAQQCAAQAGAVMEGSRINFGSGTARINKNSVALLERLTGIALACVGQDLTVEIGGHTDAQGSDADNHKLSEARAQAIMAFMAKRGVPKEGLKAVGYGESQPIADNASSAGRAKNRRITFDWQPR